MTGKHGIAMEHPSSVVERPSEGAEYVLQVPRRKTRPAWSAGTLGLSR